ncbi:major royal jelly family protein [Chelativorans salis]|uniref:Major royal jelly family protein n=1 Tax=Chelativorans salis TaxID=2978478 RepID=A0ABT2LQP1_9HYPH|nr:major royal jelly family protein [Chelativorans sp. EGI FJ00035]MCT7376651.1 major royal jelly family protein [Chelativorans sp. EGI FJ00035]
MGILDIRLIIAAAATILAGSVAAQESEPAPVIRWNSLTYQLQSGDAAALWSKSPLHGKVLVQGLKFDAAGNMYVSTARWGGADIPATLSRLVKNGDDYELQPYPSLELNAVANPQGLKAVLGFEIDQNDVMWILDQGHIAGAESGVRDEKLILWDIKANEEIQRYEFPPAVSDKRCSFLNDIVVDNESGFAYITDSGIFSDPLCGGLIVYDRNANTARRVLNATKFTNDEPQFMFNIGDRKVLKNGPMRTGADGIALSGDKQTLYWTNLTGNTLFSLPTALLRDPKVSESELQAAVRTEVVLPSNTDGLTADKDGNIYLTALQLNSVLKWEPANRRLSRVAYHPEMAWPDTLAWAPDGRLHVISNHLHVWVDGDMDFENPPVPNFTIWRLATKAAPYLN